MQYLTRSELRRLFALAYEHNRLHHLALALGFWHGLRVSELIQVRGRDIKDGLLSVQRRKNSLMTLQPIRRDSDPLFDCTPILSMAAENPEGRLFPFCRQRVDQFVRRYAKLAGLHPDKSHSHAVMKHSVAMVLWEETHSLGQIQSYLGHKASSSSLQYLREADHGKAQAAIASLAL